MSKPSKKMVAKPVVGCPQFAAYEAIPRKAFKKLVGRKARHSGKKDLQDAR